MSITQPVDSSILHEIVRIIESRRKVPERVIVKSREYLLTYLEDHQRRLEEALTRYDADRLNMLYGQLASKIKYQLLRRIPARAAAAMGMSVTPEKKAAPAKAATAAKPTAAPAKKVVTKQAKPAARPAKPAAKKPAQPAKKHAKKPAKKATAKKVVAKKVVAKKSAPKAKAAAARKPAAKRAAARSVKAKKPARRR